MLVSSISCATRNCSSSPVSSSHLPAIDAVSLLCRSRPIWVVPALARSFILASVWSGQNARTCIRVCLLFPQVHAGDTPGTPIFASHALSPSTSVLSRKIAVATCFGISSYRLSGCISHPSFHVGACRWGLDASSSHLLFHCSVICSLISLDVLVAWICWPSRCLLSF